MDERIEKLKAVFGNRPFTAASAAPILTPGKENSWGAGPMLRAMVQRGDVLLIKKANGPSEQSLYAIPVGDVDAAPLPAALVEQQPQVPMLEVGRYLISPARLFVKSHDGGFSIYVDGGMFDVSSEVWANRRLVNLADHAPTGGNADTEAMMTLLEEQEREIAKLKAQLAALLNL